MTVRLCRAPNTRMLVACSISAMVLVGCGNAITGRAVPETPVVPAAQAEPAGAEVVRSCCLTRYPTARTPELPRTLPSPMSRRPRRDRTPARPVCRRPWLDLR